MPDPIDRFERQAEWQRSRRLLDWPEKVRLAEALRDAALLLRSAPAFPKPRPDVAGAEKSGDT